MPTLDDVASGAVQYLTGFPDITALLGSFSVTDPVIANRGLPWIFKDDILFTMEGSSAAAIVCSGGGGWGSPQPLATSRWMRLALTFWVDPLRDSAQNVLESSGGTKQRAHALFTAVHQHLQRRDPDTVAWGNLITAGCELLAEPASWDSVQDGDWALQGTAYYGVTVFGGLGVTI